MARALTFETHTALAEPLRDEVLSLWLRVNAAGGAVGFWPEAPRELVAAALAAHEQDMTAGGAWLVTARDAAGRLVGLAWWVTGTNPLFRHVATIKRLMTDPGLRREGVGSALMTELHRVAATLPAVELLKLDYRTGGGLGDWYARFGYTEVARIPVSIKLPDGTYAGSVSMVRTADGSPLPQDLRT